MDYVAAFSLPQIGIACEQARLPHLINEPFALAGTDGSLAAVSEAAHTFGVGFGMSPATAYALCQGLIVLPYDLAAYREAAEAVWNLLAVESSVVEPVSPELAFMEITGSDAIQRVRGLAKALAQHVRTPVYVGIGKSKLVAQSAAQASRHNDSGIDAKVMVIPVGQEALSVAALPIVSLAVINNKTKAKLERRGLKTLGDVLSISPNELQRQFKEIAHALRKLALGEDGDRVRPLWPPPRIEHSWTFEDEVWDSIQVECALSYCATRIAEGLVHRREYCRSLALTIGLSNGSQVQGWENLNLPLDDPEALTRAACRLLRRMPPVEIPIVQVCLSATKLDAGESVQLALLDDNQSARGLPHERQQRMDAAIMHLRAKYGMGAILSATLLYQARRLHLWTYPLTHQRYESVQVTTDNNGRPVRYYRKRRGQSIESYTVKRIQNRWRETDWNWGKVLEKTCYRVIADPDDGLYELHQLGLQWKLAAAAD